MGDGLILHHPGSLALKWHSEATERPGEDGDDGKDGEDGEDGEGDTERPGEDGDDGEDDWCSSGQGV